MSFIDQPRTRKNEDTTKKPLEFKHNAEALTLGVELNAGLDGESLLPDPARF